MNKTRSTVAALTVILMLSGASALAGETQVLTGSFVWNNENITGDLQAEFTQATEGTWTVAFHFEWEGKPRVFSGTAEGSLTDGLLRGEVQTENKENTFTFSGRFENGTFNGTHAAIGRDGKERDTGTLTLAPS